MTLDTSHDLMLLHTATPLVKKTSRFAIYLHLLQELGSLKLNPQENRTKKKKTSTPTTRKPTSPIRKHHHYLGSSESLGVTKIFRLIRLKKESRRKLGPTNVGIRNPPLQIPPQVQLKISMKDGEGAFQRQLAFHGRKTLALG
jgi:hypothetical protein